MAEGINCRVGIVRIASIGLLIGLQHNMRVSWPKRPNAHYFTVIAALSIQPVSGEDA
jgi:hypothetical protein